MEFRVAVQILTGTPADAKHAGWYVDLLIWDLGAPSVPWWSNTTST